MIQITINIGGTHLAKFWCMNGCGGHFYDHPERILDGKAHCPHCGADHASPWVSELFPVTVQDPLGTHKLSALARVALGR